MDNAVEILRETIVALVRTDTPDLTARQLAVFLVCYLVDEKQTVRGLAARLNVAKPAITRILDRLEGSKLAKRTPDPSDRRSILVAKTAAGSRFLHDIKAILQQAASTVAVPGAKAGTRRSAA